MVRQTCISLTQHSHRAVRKITISSPMYILVDQRGKLCWHSSHTNLTLYAHVHSAMSCLAYSSQLSQIHGAEVFLKPWRVKPVDLTIINIKFFMSNIFFISFDLHKSQCICFIVATLKKNKFNTIMTRAKQSLIWDYLNVFWNNF